MTEILNENKILRESNKKLEENNKSYKYYFQQIQLKFYKQRFEEIETIFEKIKKKNNSLHNSFSNTLNKETSIFGSNNFSDKENFIKEDRLVSKLEKEFEKTLKSNYNKVIKFYDPNNKKENKFEQRIPKRSSLGKNYIEWKGKSVDQKFFDNLRIKKEKLNQNNNDLQKNNEGRKDFITLANSLKKRIKSSIKLDENELKSSLSSIGSICGFDVNVNGNFNETGFNNNNSSMTLMSVDGAKKNKRLTIAMQERIKMENKIESQRQKFEENLRKKVFSKKM